MMQITALGHAGFLVESADAVIVLDPWLSAEGAFDSSWFQYPRNHHLAPLVRERLADTSRARYIYVSHEHEDHFDRAFLDSLAARDVTLVVPRFAGGGLRGALASYRCRSIVFVADGDSVAVPGGAVTVYVDDQGLNRDSAALVRLGGHTFLDLNDCKITERLPAIVAEHGRPDVFTCQFSGASWHPACYDYARPVYEAIARRKMRSKLDGVVRAIGMARPRVYLASAGPPVFLDPELLHLNFDPVSIFPRAAEAVAYLAGRVAGGARCAELPPGATLDVASGEVTGPASAVSTGVFADDVQRYADGYRDYFKNLHDRYAAAVPEDLLPRLEQALRDKLHAMASAPDVPAPLYVGSRGSVERVRVDFAQRRVQRVTEVTDAAYYAVTAPAWALARVLSGVSSWEALALGMRARFSRRPDLYSTVLQGFLLLDPADIPGFCARLASVQERRDRIVVHAGGRAYTVDRYCPHQGGDLTRGWIEEDRYVVCPRHRWRFDLQDGGRCASSSVCINAVPIHAGRAVEAA